MMFIAMNRFRVKKGSEAAFEQVWLSRDTQLNQGPRLRRVPFAQGTRVRGLHALFLTHGMAEQGDVRSLDQVGSIPSCPS